MSVFTSQNTKVLPVPGDAGQTITIRQLAPFMLEESTKAAQLEFVKLLKEVGGASAVKEIEAAVAVEAPTAPAAVRPDPLVGFDLAVLLRRGIIQWSYADVPLNAVSCVDLNAPTQRFVGEEILRLSVPELFQTTEEVEAAQKNG